MAAKISGVAKDSVEVARALAEASEEASAEVGDTVVEVRVRARARATVGTPSTSVDYLSIPQVMA